MNREIVQQIIMEDLGMTKMSAKDGASNLDRRPETSASHFIGSLTQCRDV
jgi:hypothetical protein